ncbi:uncharacterized protein LOC106872922 [Octopus bimaculoides]|uniref:Uncharacterized protein n=1 Tax=Octopus bimaculoides TaxID=37653 RepID=A0A0L8H3Y9_OCTBM|nr:uncharacterized protein LOC106872922 [Octopus bimaculoides]|eukprot:XP_014775586.1 PREDICTED: uncharacterized protein LOC106872922 [Octopus bimaculoides]
MLPLSPTATPYRKRRLSLFLSRSKRSLMNFSVRHKINSVGPDPNFTDEASSQRFPYKKHLFINETRKINFKDPVSEVINTCEEDELKEKKEMMEELVQVLKRQEKRLEQELQDLEKQLNQDLKIQLTKNLDDIEMPELKELEKKTLERLYGLEWHMKQKKQLQKESKVEKLVEMMEDPELVKEIEYLENLKSWRFHM